MLRDTVARKMIALSSGNLHNINHFIKVNAYANIIATGEGLDKKTAELIDVITLVHDIAIPHCMEKYKSAAGNLQEKESEPILREFFGDIEIEKEVLERIVYVVSHHHTYSPVSGIDHQIMLESDFLVNANEGNESREAIITFRDKVFKTQTGIKLINEMYSL